VHRISGYRAAVQALVTGATGYVGSRLVSALLTAGLDVVATARDVSRLQRIEWTDRVRMLEMDVLNAGSVQTALAGCGQVEVAYYLVHALGEGDYESSDEKAAQIFARAAAEAGVGRIVYLGGFVPDEQTISAHLRSRARVGEVLQAGEVDAVLLRAAVILGAGSTSFEIIRHLVDRLLVVPLPPFMDHQVQPIAIADVLHYLVAAADPAILPAGAYDIAGPERTTYAGLARLYAATAGVRRMFVPVPLVSASAAASLMGPLTPVPSELVADLVRSLDNSMISTDRRIDQFIAEPFGGLAGIEEAIHRSLQRFSLTRPTRVGVHRLDDPMALAESDAEWAGRPPTGR
jgi:uncharacterized protein YbjT (DUF2867 family)